MPVPLNQIYFHNFDAIDYCLGIYTVEFPANKSLSLL